MSTENLDLLIDICEDHFKQRSYSVDRSKAMHPHLRWRPHIYARKNSQEIALDVRLTDSIPKFFREILKSARSLIPGLNIYVAIPQETDARETYINQTRSLKVGLFAINGNNLVELAKPRKIRRRKYVRTPSGKRAQAVILRPGSRYAAWLEISKVLSRAKQYLKVVDPYCEEDTLLYFLKVSSNVRVQLVTSFYGTRVAKEPIFKAACQRFKLDRPLFEAKKCQKIHDRFFVTESETWMLGPSAKDAGLKFGCIARIDDIQARTEIKKYFDSIWTGSGSTKIV